ncbi:MAG: hypothetical protein IT531_09410 [Burkholderiales bacterium]|nr:hypothetical protein [Burkholderiales bacterium]
MALLPEPRRFGARTISDDLLDLVDRANAADALARPTVLLDLRRALERCLAAGDEARLRRVFAHAGDALCYRLLSEALARSIDAPLAAPGTLIARAFAVPVVFVTAASAAARIAGRLADIGAIQAVFERHGVLGAARNFGLSNALCTVDALEALPAVELFRGTRTLDPHSLGAALPPADIVLRAGQEHTNLRFIAGAALSPVEAPEFTTTAANIGTWGRDCAQALAAQLALPGVTLLVLPRPPRDIVSAAHAGRGAQLETAMNLFASNAVRRLRAAVGEPIVILSAHEGAEVRVTVSSPFALDLTAGSSWPLHPLDDVAAIEHLLVSLFSDMRVADVRVLPRLLPAERAPGIALYPRCDEWDALMAAAVGH